LSQNPLADRETLRLINQRQDLVLEDLDRLNQRILDIIELYSATRDSQDPDGNGGQAETGEEPESLDSAA
jgi:hypothetical protein